MRSTIGFALFLMLLALSCSESTKQSNTSPTQYLTSVKADETPYILGIPSHFPSPKIPSDNELTVAKVHLGERLFFDKSLSIDSSVSCASCHHPNKAFSDITALSKGAKNATTERNSPSLMNVAFQPHFMREGAVPTLDLQVLSPLEGETEMAHNIVLACRRLNRDTSYKSMFLKAFGDTVTPFTLTRAIASFERTLIGGDADFDAFYNGDDKAITDEAKLGYDLFVSDRLGCTNCHSGVLFSDFSIQNNGLYREYNDLGLYRITIDKNDIGKFKVPSLRNVALTAPYMHDGSFQTLDDVIDHYASGGKKHANQSEHIKPFEMSRTERKALLAFFQSLTESSAVTNVR